VIFFKKPEKKKSFVISVKRLFDISKQNRGYLLLILFFFFFIQTLQWLFVMEDVSTVPGNSYKIQIMVLGCHTPLRGVKTSGKNLRLICEFTNK